MKAIRKFYRALFAMEQWAGIVLLLLMTSVIVLQVFSRYILNNPLIWTEELSRFLFIWLIMLYAGHSICTKGHIRIELFVDMMPRTIQKLLRICMDLLGLVTFAVLTPFFWQYVKSQHDILSTGLRLPYSVVYGAVFVGSVLLVLHLVEDLLNISVGKEEPGV